MDLHNKSGCYILIKEQDFQISPFRVKIGMSEKNVIKRITSAAEYRNAHILSVRMLLNAATCEKELIKEFHNTYKNVAQSEKGSYGSETFEIVDNDIVKCITLFNEICNKYVDVKIDEFVEVVENNTYFNIETFTANGEEFAKCTYNELELYVRKKDKFMNASKLCAKYGKQFTKLKKSKAWKNEYMEGYEDGKDVYLLTNEYHPYSGYYVNPRLINIVAMWSLNIHLVDTNQFCYNDFIKDILKRLY